MAEPRAKKTTLACDHCRRRKRKCDGRSPTCTACERGNVECLYTTTLEQRRPPQKNYVAALEARIVLLEQILKNAETSDGSSPDTHQVDTPSETTPTSSPIETPQLFLIPPLSADAANVLQSTLDPTQKETSEELDLGMTGYESLLSLQHQHKLLAQFWDWQRMHLPYVAPVPFLSAYAIHSELTHPDETIPSPPPPPPNAFAATALNVPRASSVQRTSDLAHFISPLLLYSMFAIAALFHGDPETSDMFYHRARETLLLEAANPKLATVQAVGLMATWELGHARSPASWTLIGVALSLCIRLGLNVDATPLLQSGAISQRLFETRNFVFWATFNTERFYATCMGMRPLIDRRIISTPKESSPTADTLETKKSAARPKDMLKEICISWWSPSTLGMGDVLIQAAWDAVRDLVQMMDNLSDTVYGTEAPTRSPQEILELVARNHLTIQKFIDNLPTWLRSTGALRRKESGLVYLHLFIHFTSILTNRPFLSSHHPRSDLTRNYRTLAFRVARASALQVTSLIRHIPLSSPCVTIPYIVYSACTILLLAPEDPAAMDGVRTCLACLDGMDETGYWVDSAKDTANRIRALALKWGVGLESSRRVLGLVNVKVQGGSSPGEPASSTSGSAYPSSDSGLSRPSTSGTHTSGPVQDAMLAEGIDAAIDRALQLAQPSGGVLGVPEQFTEMGNSYDTMHYVPPYQPPVRQPSARPYHPYKRTSKKHLPHVAYADSHADPQHDMHLPYAHWHTIIPPTDPNLAFPPDGTVCADVGTCFTYTIEHARDPAFVDRVGDPYAGVSMDWVRDVGSNFPRFAGGIPAFVGDEYGTGWGV
ncbi:unnamed protein product [Rhizoctonia solani]|uniref:Zn(2)-C6 fungal-type domain-containing protein n=1 Tax=Rhizoctonia solani TaxID=456999 RepID=A0A8H3AX01_9AGAM|nr:unnamed protein product [Rhizoctonia solani]